MRGEALHTDQLQVQRDTAEYPSSASGTSIGLVGSPGTGHACELTPLTLHGPAEAFLGRGQQSLTQQFRPFLTGTESSRMPASAGAGAFTAPAEAAGTADAGLPQRHCLSCPGHVTAQTPEGIPSVQQSGAACQSKAPNAK
ncbi:hypothetical protein DUNSADRAFT_9775 [Dunaliella salina]|uniref:Encoded protein n=1 Tax=Dunaliella salina TaxID=3046 RepID=A0ABQ7GGS0_DUNSA|nr:hypothetical protein DUNSADRAFT_9775 [Dunaliella salina]|eukprot:KAF5833790.1 hypothetical protein DUNSADRAFT_9775 [Dunaliella salina]